MLVRVIAPHFVAGIELTFDADRCTQVCTKSAPILKWAVGKSADELRSYFKVMKWEARIVREPTVKPPAPAQP